MTNVPFIIALSNRVVLCLQEERRRAAQASQIDRTDIVLVDRTVAELLISPKFSAATVDLATADELVGEALALVRSEIV